MGYRRSDLISFVCQSLDKFQHSITLCVSLLKLKGITINLFISSHSEAKHSVDYNKWDLKFKKIKKLLSINVYLMQSIYYAYDFCIFWKWVERILLSFVSEFWVCMNDWSNFPTFNLYQTMNNDRLISKVYSVLYKTVNLNKRVRRSAFCKFNLITNHNKLAIKYLNSSPRVRL